MKGDVRKTTASNRRLVTVIVAAVLVVILIPVYFLAIKPMLDEPAAEDEIPELLPGEVLGVNNRVMMFEQVERADIQRVEVHNDKGGFTFYRGSDNNFYIEGMETAPFDAEKFSSFVVSTGYTLSMLRLDFEDKNDDLSVYGLSDEDDYAWYTLTKVNGTTHTVRVGHAIPTGAGYYCMYEGRDAIYVLDSTIGATVRCSVLTYITPMLAYPVSSSSYLKTDNIWIMKDGEMFVAIDMKTGDELPTGTTSLAKFDLLLPEGYELNLSTYSTLISYMENFVGSETVYCSTEWQDKEKTMLKETYGIDLDAPYFAFHYTTDNIETLIVFSEPDRNGDMFAFSPLYGIVAKINLSAAPFVKWEHIQYVSKSLYSVNINDVSRIEIKGRIENGDEKLDVDAFFTLEGEGESIVIKENGKAKAYDADAVKNFRQLYKVILWMQLIDEAEMTDIEAMKPLATMKVTLDNGEELTYAFYIYSTRRCFYTVNGVGEFSVYRDSVEKLLRDTDRMVKGLPIDSDSKI